MSAALRHRDDRRRLPAISCPHCLDRRTVFSQTLKRRIPCPRCRRTPHQDRSGLQDVTAAETRHLKSLVHRAFSAELLRAVTVPALPPLPQHLLTTDRIHQRWAVSTGSGLPYTDEDLEQLAEAAAEQDDTFAHRQSKPPPLDDVTQTVIDQIIEHGEQHSGEFVRQWYCSGVTCVTMALQRGMNQAMLYAYWQDVLRYYRLRFLESAHDDLIGLVMALP